MNRIESNIGNQFSLTEYTKNPDVILSLLSTLENLDVK